MISLTSDNKTVEIAFKIALEDTFGNIKPYKAGILEEACGCLMAGRDYDTPWTRDTAINVGNALCYLDRKTAKNTLSSVLEKRDGKIFIGGEYWDSIIWAAGAYKYIRATNDMEFTLISYEAISNTLAFFEETELDKDLGLFRGAAVYGDGVSAYPDKYSNADSSGIIHWVKQEANKDLIAKTGVGLPMFSLSTNCCYFRAYEICAELAEFLGKDGSEFLTKAEALKNAINKEFWNENNGSYDYLANECDAQEGLGIAFAILFGIADEDKTEKILSNAVISKHGIACVEPNFKRYAKLGGVGRHSGTVWPHVQSFFAQAAYFGGDDEKFLNEFKLMGEKAIKNGQFHEIYHPETGDVYGGLQEFNNERIGEWGSCQHQTWCATGYISLVLNCIFGLQVSFGFASFQPMLPQDINTISVKDLEIGGLNVDVTVTRGKGDSSPNIIYTNALGKLSLNYFVE